MDTLSLSKVAIIQKMFECSQHHILKYPGYFHMFPVWLIRVFICAIFEKGCVVTFIYYSHIRIYKQASDTECHFLVVRYLLDIKTAKCYIYWIHLNQLMMRVHTPEGIIP